MKILHKTDYVVNKWAGGVTRQLLILPAGSSLQERNFDLRISSAIIDSTDSTFSDFSGYRRILLPVEGRVTLIAGARQVDLSPTEPFAFDGSATVRSTNTPGAIDFNVIYRPQRSVEVHVADRYTHVPDGRHALVFALEALTIDGKALAQHESAILAEAVHVVGKCIVVRYL